MDKCCECATDGFVRVGGGEESGACAECSLNRKPTEVEDQHLSDDAGRLVVDEEAVFLALKTMPVFGRYAKCSNDRLLRAIRKRRTFDDVARLINLYGEALVFSTAKKIHGTDAFTSEERARELFPKLFPDTPGVSTQDESHKEEADEPEKVRLAAFMRTRLLGSLRPALERVCYEFMESKMPDILRDHGWECGDGSELCAMLEAIRARWEAEEGGLQMNATIFESAKAIGEAEGHCSTTTTDMVRMLGYADSFGLLLIGRNGDEALKLLRENVEPKLAGFAKQKLCYQNKMLEAIAHIAAERAKLDELERETIGKIKEEERNYERGVTLDIMKGIRGADDVLLEWSLRKPCV